MAKYTIARTEADFPDPHKFGVWWSESRFQVYRDLSLIKSAITNDCRNREERIDRDIKVYEHVDGAWTLIYHLPKDTLKREHELWKNGPAPKTATVSEASVEAAIQSILKDQHDPNL